MIWSTRGCLLLNRNLGRRWSLGSSCAKTIDPRSSIHHGLLTFRNRVALDDQTLLLWLSPQKHSSDMLWQIHLYLQNYILKQWSHGSLTSQISFPGLWPQPVRQCPSVHRPAACGRRLWLPDTSCNEEDLQIQCLVIYHVPHWLPPQWASKTYS